MRSGASPWRLVLRIAAGLLVVGAAAGSAWAQDADLRYREAAAAFHALGSQGAASAVQWRAVAEDFRAVHRLVPRQRRGTDALYSAALAYREAWRTSGDWRELSRAADAFREFIARYRSDRLADDALMHLAALLTDGFGDKPAARDAYRRIVTDYPDGDQRQAAERMLQQIGTSLLRRPERDAAAIAAGEPHGSQEGKGAAGSGGTEGSVGTQPSAAGQPALSALTTAALAGGTAGPSGRGRVKRVEFWSALEWTRVIVTTDPDVRYEANRLAPTRSHNARLYFDLAGASVGGSQPAVTNVDDAVLERIRIGHRAGATRIVLDLKQIERYEVKDFRLPTERKIVVDLHAPAAVIAEARKRLAPALAAERARTAPQPASSPRPAPTRPLAEPRLTEPLMTVPLALQVRSIMIDPGHGGHDPGAQGYGVEEKDVALEISKHLRAVLKRQHPALRVGLTREDDRFIPLGERPEIAKRFGADLFVSVHLNASEIRRFHGVETYFLNLTNDREALRVAARENATSEQHVGDLNGILLDLLRDTNLIESGELAKVVQASLVGTLREEHGAVRDLGVKQAPFLVLMGAEMPGVLVEAGFITNRDENQRLQDPQYLARIAEGIYDGLRRYIEQQNVVAAGSPAGPLASNSKP